MDGQTDVIHIKVGSYTFLTKRANDFIKKNYFNFIYIF